MNQLSAPKKEKSKQNQKREYIKYDKKSIIFDSFSRNLNFENQSNQNKNESTPTITSKKEESKQNKEEGTYPNTTLPLNTFRNTTVLNQQSVENPTIENQISFAKLGNYVTQFAEITIKVLTTIGMANMKIF